MVSEILKKAFELMADEEHKTYRNNEQFKPEQYEFLMDLKSFTEILEEEIGYFGFRYKAGVEAGMFGIKASSDNNRTRHIKLVKTVGEYIWEESEEKE